MSTPSHETFTLAQLWRRCIASVAAQIRELLQQVELRRIFFGQ